MVFKKYFTLLVATGTTTFFALVSIISDQHCRLGKVVGNSRQYERQKEQTMISEMHLQEAIGKGPNFKFRECVFSFVFPIWHIIKSGSKLLL